MKWFSVVMLRGSLHLITGRPLLLSLTIRGVLPSILFSHSSFFITDIFTAQLTLIIPTLATHSFIFVVPRDNSLVSCLPIRLISVARKALLSLTGTVRVIRQSNIVFVFIDSLCSSSYTLKSINHVRQVRLDIVKYAPPAPPLQLKWLGTRISPS